MRHGRGGSGFGGASHGFKAKVAGTYNVNVNMTFQTEKRYQNIVMRLAKNALVNDVADSDNENPGPLGNVFIYGNNYPNQGKVHSIGCAQITHIMTLAVLPCHCSLRV